MFFRDVCAQPGRPGVSVVVDSSGLDGGAPERQPVVTEGYRASLSAAGESNLASTELTQALVQVPEMHIAEIFHSIQGEGKLTGVPSAFIRTSGCNLRCVWCDSPYTSWEPEGEEIDLGKIIEQVATFPTRFVVLTGGEPMIHAGVTDLTRGLRERGLHITVETAATIHRDMACDLASISPKLANSTPRNRGPASLAERHEAERINLPVIQRLMDDFEHQLKFVVDAASDLAEIDTLLEQLRGVKPENVLLMPQGTVAAELHERSAWLANLCKERGFRFCPRLHIMLYGNTRGT